MDPSHYPNFYPPLPIPPSIGRYPYPATSSAVAGRGGMIFYPQPVSVDRKERESPPASASSPRSSGESGQKRPMDKKLRRQIANSNERRRMQSINEGFHNLRLLMPHLQGEKMSKASILQNAADHICRMNQERERLIQQNTSLRVMLSRYLASSETNRMDVLAEHKVNKATSPMSFDDERAASKELEQIFGTQRQLDLTRMELERERALRRSLEAKCKHVKDRTPSEEEDEDTESEVDDGEVYRHKRPRTGTISDHTTAKSNLDIIVRAIRQIEGDAFSRSTTPTCGLQERERNGGAGGRTFVPISSSSMESTRVSPITPVYAS